MSQNRLRNMGVISIERELVTKINFEDVIYEFATKKTQKVKFRNVQKSIFFFQIII